ncbi:LysR substrate-binding domain-containing protein [Salinicola sp. LHM]|uniref:LysR substrate-binding domain-containing protein n=1 Tax=Salinicola sp. LHM TaxID=3065298 RepID=UPI002ACD6D77|nr:LysR substrate-binding domain-containing protein [Salinicola sp. LHM]WQH34120.1 LysR substrate-binding domain-containing protein [Salinicola sp. LHM]
MAEPTLSALKAFEVVARTGSLRAAAEALHITQSAVSHQLRRLEISLEVSLLQRHGRGVRLTATGRKLAGELLEGFSRIDAAVSAVKQVEGPEQLRISCLPSVAIRWLIPRLNRFRKRYPHISLNFQYAGTMRGELPPPEIDVMITWQDDRSLREAPCLPLFSGATWPVASPLYLDGLSPHRYSTPAHLLQLELLHDESYRPWREWFKKHGLHPSTLSEGTLYQDFNLMGAAAIAGQGIALCPTRLIETELTEGTLVKLFNTPANENRTYDLFHHPSPEGSVVAFCEWLQEEANAEK